MVNRLIVDSKNREKLYLELHRVYPSVFFAVRGKECGSRRA